MNKDELGRTLAEIWMPFNCSVVSIRFEQRFKVPDVFIEFDNGTGFRYTEYALGNMRFVWWDAEKDKRMSMRGHLTACSYNDKIFDNVDDPFFDDDDEEKIQSRRDFAEKWSIFVAVRAKLCEQILYGTAHEKAEAYAEICQTRGQQ